MSPIPFPLRETGEPIKAWDGVGTRSQAILDMRSEIDKANVRLNRKVNTFKKENCDVWQDRPQLVSYEICPPGRWLPSVHHLTRFKQIVQVTPDESKPSTT